MLFCWSKVRVREGSFVISFGGSAALHTEAGGLVLVVGLGTQTVLNVSISRCNTIVGMKHPRPYHGSDGIGRGISKGQGLGATIRLVVELEVIQLWCSHTNLWGKGACVLLDGSAQVAESGSDCCVVAFLYAEAHEIRLHILLLQLLEIGSEFLTEDTQEGVVFGSLFGGSFAKHCTCCRHEQQAEDERFL